MPDETVVTKTDDTGAAAGEGKTGDGDAGSWLTGLPEEFRTNPDLLTVPDVPTLAKNYLERGQLVGRKGVILPKDDDPPEKFEEFYAALGRPETPDKYDFARPNMPEGLQYAEDFEKDFRAQAHKLGISQKAAKGIYDWFVPLTMQWAETQRDELVKAHQDLEKDWGDKLEGNLKIVQQTFQRFADPEDFEAMFSGATPLGNNPRLARFLFKVGQAMKEDGLVSGKGAETLTIDQQITEIEKNPHLYDATHPEQKDLQMKRDALYKQKYPEAAAG
jgi:hypothetical protein